MRRADSGFTLLEVVVALAILGISLGALLSAQSSSLGNAARARDLTIATLLARSKMIDIERHVFSDGFVEGDDSDNGDFSDEGQPDFKWSYKVSQVKLDLSALGSLCNGFSTSGDDSETSDCQNSLGGMGGMFESFTQGLANAVRAVALTVSWPAGRFTKSMQVHELVTRENFTFAPAGLNATLQSNGQAADSTSSALGTLLGGSQ